MTEPQNIIITQLIYAFLSANPINHPEAYEDGHFIQVWNPEQVDHAEPIVKDIVRSIIAIIQPNIDAHDTMLAIRRLEGDDGLNDGGLFFDLGLTAEQGYAISGIEPREIYVSFLKKFAPWLSDFENFLVKTADAPPAPDLRPMQEHEFNHAFTLAKNIALKIAQHDIQLMDADAFQAFVDGLEPVLQDPVRGEDYVAGFQPLPPGSS